MRWDLSDTLQSSLFLLFSGKEWSNMAASWELQSRVLLLHKLCYWTTKWSMQIKNICSFLFFRSACINNYVYYIYNIYQVHFLVHLLISGYSYKGSWNWQVLQSTLTNFISQSTHNQFHFTINTQPVPFHNQHTTNSISQSTHKRVN